jgi:hypothetical protein
MTAIFISFSFEVIFNETFWMLKPKGHSELHPHNCFYFNELLKCFFQLSRCSLEMWFFSLKVKEGICTWQFATLLQFDHVLWWYRTKCLLKHNQQICPQPQKQVVCQSHCGLAIYIKKSILRPKKNNENSNISPCKNITLKKNPLRETKILQDIITL